MFYIFSLADFLPLEYQSVREIEREIFKVLYMMYLYINVHMFMVYVHWYKYIYMENTSWGMQYGTQQHMSYHSYMYVIKMTLHYN